jgi:hypothetical protein
MDGSKTVLHRVGGWGKVDFWEKKRGKVSRKKGVGLRALGIGRWSSWPRICDCFHCARWEANYLQNSGQWSVINGVVRKVSSRACGTAGALRVWGWWFPRSPKARDLGHPDLWAGTCATRHHKGGLAGISGLRWGPCRRASQNSTAEPGERRRSWCRRFFAGCKL